MLSPPCRPPPEVWGCCWQIQACWLTFEVGVGGQFDAEAPSGTLQIRSQIMVAGRQPSSRLKVLCSGKHSWLRSRMPSQPRCLDHCVPGASLVFVLDRPSAFTELRLWGGCACALSH